MKSKTFRLSEGDLEQLKYICSERGCSQSDAIRSAIQNEADAIRSGERPEESEESHEMVFALVGQLAVKDEQIAALNRALEAAQETAKAAQVLHAQERKAIESAEQKSRWRRLRDAWRG